MGTLPIIYQGEHYPFIHQFWDINFEFWYISFEFWRATGTTQDPFGCIIEGQYTRGDPYEGR
jgi:hypothetical protein